MESLESIYAEENKRLRHLVSALGFDPAKVVAEFGNIDVCKSLALASLRVHTDFSATSFTEAGIQQSIKWLNDLKKT